MKKVAGKMKLELAQFRELEAFTKFGSDLDENTRKRIERGYRTIEILKQDQYEAMPMEKQAAVIWALVNGYLDEVEKAEVKRWEKEFLNYLENSGLGILEEIAKEKDLTESIEEKLKKAVEDFNRTFSAEQNND